MTHRQRQERIADGLFADHSRPDVPGASAAVIGQTGVLYLKGFGMADLENGIPIRPETNFRLASLTKQFTATSVLMLIEQGLLSLREPLADVLGELPPWGSRVAIAHLLNHTSGVPDYENLIPRGTRIPVRDRDVLRLLLGVERADFPPGTRFHYSNSGYALLAMAVEARSGMTFAEFLKRRIFLTLGMKDTVAYERGISTVRNRAFGYAGTRRGFKRRDQSLTSSVLGDGGIYSSVVDLVRWDRAVRAGRLLRPSSWKRAFTAGPASDFPGSRYGFGWYVARRSGVKEVWHYGETTGFTTRIHRFPAKCLTIILLANRAKANLAVLAERLTELYW